MDTPTSTAKQWATETRVPAVGAVRDTLDDLRCRTRPMDEAARAALATALLGCAPSVCVICGAHGVVQPAWPIYSHRGGPSAAVTCVLCRSVPRAHGQRWADLVVRITHRPVLGDGANYALVVACHLHGLPLPASMLRADPT